MFAAACGWHACEGGVRRRVVVCSARRSARVVRGLIRAFLYYLSIYPLIYPPTAAAAAPSACVVII